MGGFVSSGSATGCMMINEFSAWNNLYKAWENNRLGQCFVICHLLLLSVTQYVELSF